MQRSKADAPYPEEPDDSYIQATMASKKNDQQVIPDEDGLSRFSSTSSMAREALQASNLRRFQYQFSDSPRAPYNCLHVSAVCQYILELAAGRYLQDNLLKELEACDRAGPDARQLAVRELVESFFRTLTNKRRSRELVEGHRKGRKKGHEQA